MDPFSLDWGKVTPEAFDKAKNQALHVINTNMQSREGRDYSRIYVVGRVLWFSTQLPPGTSHRVRIDATGQSVPVKTLNEWRAAALSEIRKGSGDIEVEIEFMV